MRELAISLDQTKLLTYNGLQVYQPHTLETLSMKVGRAELTALINYSHNYFWKIHLKFEVIHLFQLF